MLTGRAGATDVVFVAGIDGGRFGRVVLANAVGLDDGGMAGEVGGCQLIAAAGRDNDIDNFKNGRHLLDGQRSRAIGLDIFHGGIEAGDAEVGGPVFRALLGEQLVAPGHGEFVECSGALGGQQMHHGVPGQFGQLDGNQLDAHASQLIERGQVEVAIVDSACAGGAAVRVIFTPFLLLVRRQPGGHGFAQGFRYFEGGWTIADSQRLPVEVEHSN